MSDLGGLPDDLARLGAALHSATTDDLVRERAARRRALPRPRRGVFLGTIAALIVVPGVAVAAVSLISGPQVAASMPAGTLALFGTEPRCLVVHENVEFSCTLARPPGTQDTPAGHWMNATEPTIDATKHVNGGCLSRNAAGTRWTCFVGEEAVRQALIGPKLLGVFAPNPTVG